MHVFPNGQNIQIISSYQPEQAPAPVLEVNSVTKSPGPSSTVQSTLAAFKQIAPHMNRQQRRAKLAELKSKAKNETAALAKAEIAKQAKEKARG